MGDHQIWVRPYFSRSTQRVQFVFLGWFVRWEVGGCTIVFIYGVLLLGFLQNSMQLSCVVPILFFLHACRYKPGGATKQQYWHSHSLEEIPLKFISKIRFLGVSCYCQVIDLMEIWSYWYIYLYIYIYMCVCVCVCVYLKNIVYIYIYIYIYGGASPWRSGQLWYFSKRISTYEHPYSPCNWLNFIDFPLGQIWFSITHERW